MSNHILGSNSSRVGLGVRKPTVRGPLHDPDADGAVVLYTPPPLSAQDATNPEIKCVHVVLLNVKNGTKIANESSEWEKIL